MRSSAVRDSGQGKSRTVLAYVYLLLVVVVVNVVILFSLLAHQNRKQLDIQSRVSGYHFKSDISVLNMRDDLYAAKLWFSETDRSDSLSGLTSRNDNWKLQANKIENLIYDLNLHLDEIDDLNSIYREEVFIQIQSRLRLALDRMRKEFSPVDDGGVSYSQVSVILQPFSELAHQLQRLHENAYKKWENVAAAEKRKGASLIYTVLLVMVVSFAAVVVIVILKIGRMLHAQQQMNKELAASEERVNLLLNSTEEGILGLDVNGNCTFVNPSCLDMLGYDNADELIGNNAHHLVHVTATHQQTNGDEFSSHSSAEVFRRKDGRLFDVEYWSRPIVRDGAMLGRVVSFLDIRERKKQENEIRELNERLEDRVAKRTVELQSSNEKLQESLAMLRKTQDQLIQSEKMAALGELVAGVAHEINTPLGIGVTAISHFKENVDVYQQRYDDGVLTRADFESMLRKSVQAADMILSNLLRAAELVRSFKKVAVDQTSEQRRVIDLKQYLAEIMHSLQPKLKKTQISVAINGPDNLLIDSYPGAISQLITNLVMNSLIHGFEGKGVGAINIDFSEQEGEVTLRYSDNGVGMNKEQVEKVFDPFFTSKRGQGGTGLGMHIAFNLVHHTLGGQLAVVSHEGHGVHFTVRFPIKFEELRQAGSM